MYIAFIIYSTVSLYYTTKRKHWKYAQYLKCCHSDKVEHICTLFLKLYSMIALLTNPRLPKVALGFVHIHSPTVVKGN